MKNNFRIPNSLMVIVRWFRNNQFHDTKIKRPANNEMLRLEMLNRGVGYSEIRAVKSDRPTQAATTADLKSLQHRFAH